MIVPFKVIPRFWLSVDPGLQGTGVAVWRGRKLVSASVFTMAHDELDWWERSRVIGELIRRANPYAEVVVIEMMEHFGAGRDLAWKTGDLQRTVFLIGMIGGLFPAGVIQPIRVRDWKGQLPKSVVIDRIEAHLGTATCNRLNIQSHAWDAVGIGLWAQGKL